MPNNPGISFATLILAAGASTRMGTPKMLLPWGETSIIGHIISQWTALRTVQTAVVTAPPENPVTQELNRLRFPVENRIINAHPEIGMFSSIQCAARWDNWVPALSHWMLVLGDQPQIRSATLEALIEQTRKNPEKICQLAHQGRAKHPVALPRFAFEKLASSTSGSLREFLTEFTEDRCVVECGDESLNYDLDYPEDYEAARRKFPA